MTESVEFAADAVADPSDVSVSVTSSAAASTAPICVTHVPKSISDVSVDAIALVVVNVRLTVSVCASAPFRGKASPSAAALVNAISLNLVSLILGFSLKSLFPRFELLLLSIKWKNISIF